MNMAFPLDTQSSYRAFPSIMMTDDTSEAQHLVLSPTLGYQLPVHPQALQVAPVSNTQPQAHHATTTLQSQPPQPQPQTQAPPQLTRARRGVPNQGQLQRAVPPEEDMQLLFQGCGFSHGNA